MASLTTRIAAAALLLGLGSATSAQAAAGNGIRLGGSAGRLHPWIELEARYDSNVYVSTTGAEEGDVILHVRPGLTLNVPGEMTSVDFSGNLDWSQYLGSQSNDTSDLSKLYADAQLGITVNRTGTVGLELDDIFRRSDQPQALSLGAGLISNYNTLQLRVPWRPGGGALTTAVYGGWLLESYDNFFSGQGTVCDPLVDPRCDPDYLAKLGYNEYSLGAELRWKFLPRTSALLDGSWFQRVSNDSSPTANEPGGFRIQTGMTGLVTPHVSTTLKVGYGSTLSVTPTLDTWLATAEAEWLPTETSSVKAGYSHDLQVDPTINYVRQHLFLNGRQRMAQRLTLRLDLSWDMLDYAGPGPITDLLSVSPGVVVDVAKWCELEFAYAYTDRATPGAPTSPLFFDYSKNEVWLRARFTY